MAFRLPTHPPQRQQSYSGTQPASLQIPPASSYPQQPQHQDDESTEWILFSPSQADSTTARTHTTSTERTPRTAGLSRFSDFGSLDTAAQSDDGLDEEEEELEEDNNTELDSLDDGLHAFREPAVYRTESTPAGPDDSAILPAHDGLGMFAASSQDVQNQLWQHEQYNPRRRGEVRPRRRSSVQRHLETVEEMEAREVERDRWQRIEQWRMEQSRALLQEIEKETRRRRNSRASRASLASERLVARQSAKSDVVEATAQADLPKTGDEPPAEPQDDAAADESFWRRITRKVIRDLIGIDDSLLSVILGESIVHEDGETKHAKQDGVSTSNAQMGSMDDEPQRPLDMDQMMKDAGDASQSDNYWHERLLERIARELGILVHQLCEHPGAFSTYIRNSASISNQYAGIPISHPPSSLTPSTSRPFPLSRSTSNTSNLASTYSPQFAPTLQDTAATKHAALFGIEEEGPLFAPTHLGPNQPLSPTTPHSATAETLSEAARLERERDYWERELDIKMVFHFLRSRFSKNIPFTNNDNSTNNNNNTTATTSSPHRRNSTTASTRHGQQQDPSQRAAIIRQHHPLVARAHARSQSHIQRPMNNTWATSVSSSAAAGGSGSPILRHHIRRASSSCASQSAKVSANKRTMAGSASGSSRHYWDIGGSVGSGSVVVSAVGGGVGGWGDV